MDDNFMFSSRNVGRSFGSYDKQLNIICCIVDGIPGGLFIFTWNSWSRLDQNNPFVFNFRLLFSSTRIYAINLIQILSLVFQKISVNSQKLNDLTLCSMTPRLNSLLSWICAYGSWPPEYISQMVIPKLQTSVFDEKRPCFSVSGDSHLKMSLVILNLF